MVSCYVCGRTRNFNSRFSQISFHRFPYKDHILQTWQDFMKSHKLSLQNIKKNHFICSSHFVPESFIVRKNYRALKKYAIPTITVSRVKFSKTLYQEEISKFIPPSEKVDELIRKKYEVHELPAEIHNKNKKVKLLQQSIRRKNKQISSMIDIITKFKNETRFTNEDIDILLKSFGFKKSQVHCIDHNYCSPIEDQNVPDSQAIMTLNLKMKNRNRKDVCNSERNLNVDSWLKYLKASKKAILQQNKKIKLLASKNFKLREKVKTLNNLVDHLKDKIN